jgi:AraC-like DNA-binding protein
MASTIRDASGTVLPIFCLVVSQIRHEPIAPTYAEPRAAGDVIARHRHDDHQLIYVSTGVLAVQTERGSWAASYDRAVWIPAGMWHQHRFYGQSSFHTIGLPVGEAPLPDSSPTIVAVSGLLRELLIACTDAELPTAESRRIRAVLRDRLRRAIVQPLALPTAQDRRLIDACRLVESDLRQPRTLAWLARAVSTSERTLARLFRTEFGMTYPQWRTNVRVFHAMIRLAEGATVTETAQQCGWATTSAFIDTFARTMGQTPGVYRSAADPISPA